MPIVTFLTKLVLALRLSLVVPSLDLATAYDHAAAAVDNADEHVSPELLLGVAYIESRFDPTATSRIEGSVRKTGSYPSTAPPRGGIHGSLFCGPLQTYAGTWRRCLAMRDLAVGYRAGAAELNQWLRDRRVGGDIRKALLGHACGNAGLRANRCRGYPSRVLRFVERLGVSHSRTTPRV